MKSNQEPSPADESGAGRGALKSAQESSLAGESGAGRGAAALKSTQEHSPASEYGYLQIDGYAQKHSLHSSKVRARRSRVEPGPKVWVPLPRGVIVESYPRPCTNTTEFQPCKLMAPPLHSCLRQRQHTCRDGGEVLDTPRSTLSGGSDSTSASSSENRHVHFFDGVVPGAESTTSTGGPNSNHEWIYIDRDICGFSLHEYAPNAPSHQDFASSQFGRDFVVELMFLEDSIRIEQMKAVLSDTELARDRQEDKELDQALGLASLNQRRNSTQHCSLRE